MNQSSIVLIGMPGSGKSTLGILLAKTLRMPFIDTDLIIQLQENRFLQDIINHDGLEAFLSIEERTILDLGVKNHIIATGGSAIYRKASVDHLKAMGTLVYLQLPYAEIRKRIRNIVSRGIAKSKDQSLFDLYNERIPLYEKYADILVNCSGKRMETIIEEIKNTLGNDEA